MKAVLASVRSIEVLQTIDGTEVGYQYRIADQKPVAARINLKTGGSLKGGMTANTLFIMSPLHIQHNLSNEETKNLLRTFKVE